MHLFFKVDKKNRRRGLHRKKRHLKRHHAREWFYPSIGLHAFMRFMEIQIKRTPGSVHAIAFGVAAGTFASFTPFIGLHALVAILLCLSFRGNYIVGVLATLVGNPWTFPFIWVSIYYFGNIILGRVDAAALPTNFEFSDIIANFSVYFDAYLWPMLVGGIPTGLVIASAFYGIVYVNLSSYRRIRKHHLKKRRVFWMKHLAGDVVYFTSSVGKSIFSKTSHIMQRDKRRKRKHGKEEE